MTEKQDKPVTMTDLAIAKVKELIADAGKDDLKLRAFLYGGGCSGVQCGFTFDDSVKEKDNQFECDGVTLLVDPLSIQYLAGAEIDFEDEQFTVKNIELPQGGCGGGCSGCG